MCRTDHEKMVNTFIKMYAFVYVSIILILITDTLSLNLYTDAVVKLLGIQ